MKPYQAKKLPIEYKIDKELLKLLSEANEKYGKYQALLKMFKFDPKFFLNSIILGESLRSSQIEGTQISQDDLYYLDYKEENNDTIEVKNLKNMIQKFSEEIKKGKQINIQLVNKMNLELLKTGRGSNKNPGKIRIKQNYIGPRGCTIEEATFIPPIPEEVPILLDNLFEYMKDQYTDPILINLAISHMQFETIHPYSDGNGRMGRALIPLQLSILKEEEPILYLSEIIEIYKPTYYRMLNEARQGNIEGFIKFFLQCIIEQCTAYIYKIEKINQIYDEDMRKIENKIKGRSIYKIMPILIKDIVVTSKSVEEQTKLHKNTIDKTLQKLVELEILKKEKKKDTNRITYRYDRIYNVFIRNQN